MSAVTTKQVSDALLKLVSAKDGLYPYVDYLHGVNDGGVVAQD